jgi:cation diffusion facilitator CzcD-associated flavoprotein CzcO
MVRMVAERVDNEEAVEEEAVAHVDVVVVGAGLSGIGAGYRLQTECPDRSYVILEARDTIGGTWDLFRYPGIRSDSDMFTLGYPFEPWRAAKAIADGPSILRYVRQTATKYGVDRRIRFNSKVVGLDWSTDEAHWTVTVEHRDRAGTTTSTVTCDFVYCCAGYYDYNTGYAPEFPGIEDFAGEVVHPQFWPEDLDYAGKRVVVIGSGATAVTLVPAMTEGEGAVTHVTMLQRTPTWITALPGQDAIADRVRKHLPASLAHQLVRMKNVVMVTGFYQLCRRRPDLAKRLLLGATTRILGDPELVKEHFTPPYDPWDQRLCIVPDADFFKAMKRGDAEVVTDQIARFVPAGIQLRSGRVLEADIVVTATGLQLQLFGGVRPSVDGRTVEVSEQFVWRGAMVTGLPNFAYCVGYTNASWTLRADLTSRLVCKVLNHLRDRDLASVVPVAEQGLTERPLLDLSSGYIQRSIADLPRQGDHGVWRVRQNYLVDATTTLRTNLDKTLEGTPRSQVRRSAQRGGAGRRRPEEAAV